MGGVVEKPQAYAVFDSADNTLTFFRDDENKYSNNQVIGSKIYHIITENMSYDYRWGEKHPQLETVVFLDNIYDSGSKYWFYQASNLKEVRNISNLHIKNSISSMFMSCVSLEEIDLTGFDTSTVVDMENAFRSCENLKTIYADNSFNTSKVTSSNKLFGGCLNLIGGKGTKYATYLPEDKTYARIDNTPDEPGYFTLKE